MSQMPEFLSTPITGAKHHEEICAGGLVDRQFIWSNLKRTFNLGD
jgi:hypothetical protein